MVPEKHTVVSIVTYFNTHSSVGFQAQNHNTYLLKFPFSRLKLL